MSEKYIVISGVSGSGKTTIGKLLAKQLGSVFIEGDDFHSEANVQKMSAGISLNDEDRRPWLFELKNQLERYITAGESVVLSCSALKKSYRDILRLAGNEIHFIFLDVPYDVLYEHLRNRSPHFMKADLLDSQLKQLELPHDDEQYTHIIETKRLSAEDVLDKCLAIIGT